MTDTNVAGEHLLTTREVARLARLHERTVLHAVSLGALKSSRPGKGRGRLYRREWVAEWLDMPLAELPPLEQIPA